MAEMAAPAFRCIVCGHGEAQPFLAACDDLYLAKPYRVDYHRCRGCSLVQQHPVPVDVSDFYAAYPVHAAKSRAYSLFRRALMAGVYLPPGRWPTGTRLLDFGCGDGWYLQWCLEAGLQAIGFEHGQAQAQALSQRIGTEVLADPDALLARHAGQLDLITLHFVVEHLTAPLQTFALLGRLLRPGGCIRYVVPHIDSWEFRLFGRRWHSLDAPRHIAFLEARHAALLAQASSLQFEGTAPAAFPNGFGGSLPTTLLGRFSQAGFLLTLPLSWLLTRLAPGGNMAYTLRRAA